MKKTQLEAYKHINNKKSGKCALVLSTVKHMGGATFFELNSALKWPINCITGRVNELCKVGLVSDSGETRVNPKTNRRAIVWVANV